MGNKFYSVKETTMKKLADNIREITGTTGEIKGDSLIAVVENTSEEIDIQTDLIGQIQTALQGKAAGGSNEDVTAETDAYTVKISQLETAVTALETELAGKASGGSGGGSVETCTLSTGNSHSILLQVAFTVYEGGQAQKKIISVATPNTVLSENVIKNSLVCFDSTINETSIGLKFEFGSQSGVYSIVDNSTFAWYPCFAKGTLILLADGTVKAIENVTYDDELLVWDFDSGCYASAKPLWIKIPQKSTYYYHCVFDNGNTLDLVGDGGKCHRIFSVDENCFLSATDCVGMTVMTNKGATKLLSCERIDKDVDFYNIITKYHMNLFANGILTSCRLNNIYPIDNMKFVKDNRELIDIEQYFGIDEDFYKDLRLSERNVDDIDWINDYVKRLRVLMLDKEVTTNV